MDPEPPVQLVIETATSACSAALLSRDGTVVDELHELVGRGHAERLVPMIDELLSGRRPASILVDCGPGSFTGVRVGLAAAHGLGIGWKVQSAGFSSLSLLAAASGESEVAVAMEGGHGELFVQTFAGEPPEPVDALRSLTPSAAAQEIGPELVIGSGAQALVEARGWGRWTPAVPRASDARFLTPAAKSLTLRPIYGRAPDAKPGR